MIPLVADESTLLWRLLLPFVHKCNTVVIVISVHNINLKHDVRNVRMVVFFDSRPVWSYFS